MLIGIVGKANVGKSTFFKASTLAEVEIANYPFATIKPNHGTGYVKVNCADKFFNVKCNPRFGYCIDGKRFVPFDMIDVAGLVPGAHEGKGLGNQFLDDLRQADVLIHVVDVAGTTNEKGEPITDRTYDPAKDIRFLEEELDFWYLGILKKGWEKFARTINQSHEEVRKALEKQLSAFKVTEEIIKESLIKLNLDSKPILQWTDENIFELVKEFRKKTKPMVIACNKIDVAGARENFERMKKEFPQHLLIPCSSESELALREAAKHGIIKYIPGENTFEVIHPEKLNDAQTKALDFIKKNILDQYSTTGVQDCLNYAVFGILKYISIFPGGVNKLSDKDGNVIPDCFLLPPNSTALDFAFKLHTDIGNGFIRAIDVKTKRVVGKEHLLKDGDVVEIVTSK